MALVSGAGNDLKWIWKISRKTRWQVILCCIIEAAYFSVSMFFIWVSKHLIDIATGDAEGRILTFAFVLGGCILLQQALSIASARIEAKSEITLRGDVRSRLFGRIMTGKWAGKEKMHSGDLLNRLMDDVTEITETVCYTIPKLTGTLVQLVLATYFIAKIDYRLALAVFFIMPVALILSKSCFRKLRRLTRDIKDSDSSVQSHIQENIQHRTLISAMEHTDYSRERLNSLQDELEEKVITKTDFALFSRTMIRLGAGAGYATVLLWGVFGLQNGTMTFGMMAAFLQLISQIQRPILDLSRQVPGFIRTAASAERLREIDDIETEDTDKHIVLDGTSGIRIENLSFSYPDGEKLIFDNFSYDFKPGSLTAIFGETGIGKSTLIRLMLALLEPDKGNIYIYNKDNVLKASPSTRGNFIYVPQGNTLISGTILDNLLLGRPDATQDEIREALHYAMADFVWSLPDGLNTVCGESGAGLSEGQAQRIAIARALLRQGGILLLDEPTSALDSETEKALIANLRECSQNKTLIIITHRESISELCPETLFIKK